MTKIRVVIPVVRKDRSRSEKKFAGLSSQTHEISVVAIDRGPASIECEFDEALATPDVIAKILEAERDGCDAVVIDCFGDPGVRPGREVVDIPVIGAGEASMHLAAILGHRFSVVTVLENIVPLFKNNCKIYGLESKLASIRFVNIPVLDLHDTDVNVVDRLLIESIKAIEEDGAHSIALGCTGMAGLARAVQNELWKNDYKIPVIDPLEAALKMAQILVEMKLSPSKRTYPFPPKKEIVGYEINISESKV